MRSVCLVHEVCKRNNALVQPSGRRVDFQSKTMDVKDLNSNFLKHLGKRDRQDRTNHAETWQRLKIHSGASRYGQRTEGFIYGCRMRDGTVHVGGTERGIERREREHGVSAHIVLPARDVWGAEKELKQRMAALPAFRAVPHSDEYYMCSLSTFEAFKVIAKCIEAVVGS